MLLEILLLPASQVVLADGVEIPIIAYILNSEPEVLSIEFEDVDLHPIESVDPEIPFLIRVTCRDNNTIGDIDNVTLLLVSPNHGESDADSPDGHYTISWRKSMGFSGYGVEPSLCSEPVNMSAAAGCWTFGCSLDGVALASGEWRVVVRVADENSTARMETSLRVNEFIQLWMSSGSLSLSGEPGGVVVSPLNLSYVTNHEIEIDMSCTEFRGTEYPDIRLQPADFTVDDDPSLEEPDVGWAPVVLSSSRRLIRPSIIGRGYLMLYVTVSIPSPFMDQDYEGRLIFYAS